MMEKFEPIAFCLQETLLPDSYGCKNSHYTFFSKSAQNVNTRISGGVGILVRKSTPHSPIALNTNLQAVACRVSLPQPLTLCTIYLPPNSTWQYTDLLQLISQLPRPILFLGDFNAHSSLWGCDSNDCKGTELETFLVQSNLCLLNDKSATYIHPATGAHSSLDISFCDPQLFLDYNWHVHNDLCGSDHFPLVLHRTNAPQQTLDQKWVLKQADWGAFSFMCLNQIVHDDICNADDSAEAFASAIINVANSTIRKTSNRPRTIRNPWFNNSCKTAITERKQALKNVKNSCSSKNIETLRIARAEARRATRCAKRESWRTYVSQLTSKTPSNKTWSMIRRITGKHTRPPVNHLQVNDRLIEHPQEIANALASNISHNSSTHHCTDRFQRFKARQEQNQLKFESDNSEDYNAPFSLAELQEALHRANDSAAGPDNIHYQMLKHLPDPSLAVLLKVFNNIWESGKFPRSWSTATVIPIPKPGKDPSFLDSYRPIALTSCICKTFERLVNNRLVWYLEHNHLVTEFQSGFRKHRSTTDQLLRLESFIREAFVRREHVVSVFFDLEKAYDTTWKYGILRDLHQSGLRGHLPAFVSNFLNNRNFRVRLGSHLSDNFPQEMGVPQGSILSVTLFVLKINNIIKCLPPAVRCSLFVDDFLICYRSKSIRLIERQLQRCLNNIELWADENGFKFSQTKTVCMHFCLNYQLHHDPQLQLYGNTIPVVRENKFLGMMFDSRLTFVPHIKYLKNKCLKAMNLLRVVSHKDWGADTATLLKIYQTHIRSKLDYGSTIYGSARKSYLQLLDTIQNSALRICLGAYRTSPAASLHVEANDLPLELRRRKLALQYILKLSSTPHNPSYECVFGNNFKTAFASRPHIIPTLGIRLEKDLVDTGINFSHIANYTHPSTPPWLLRKASFYFDLHTLGNKSDTPPHQFRAAFHELLSAFERHTRIYTDGSKNGSAVAAAAVTIGTALVKRLPDCASIFSAEATAILLALDIARKSPNQQSVIISDSLSCLHSIKNKDLTHPVTLRILEKVDKLISCGATISFIWIPSHLDIAAGNTAADAAAKAALNLAPSDARVPSSDFRPLIHKSAVAQWQQSWDDDIRNKLRQITPSVGTQAVYHLPRRDEIIMHRLRIGHTHLTHAYLLHDESPPKCISCQSELTVEHLLLHCSDFDSKRSRHFHASTIHELFHHVPPHNVLQFLKDINMYYRI